MSGSKLNVFQCIRVYFFFLTQNIFYFLFHLSEGLSAGDIYGNYHTMKTFPNCIFNLFKGQRTFIFKLL